jgi:hypothetical protein
MISTTWEYRYASKMVVMILFVASLSGCMTTKSFVDPTLPQVEMTAIKVPANPQPVQLFFEFKTKGNVNSTATEVFRPKIVALFERSKCFSQVTSTDTANGRSIFLTIDNFPVTNDPGGEGVKVGLTFGLVGTIVTDGYKLEGSIKEAGKPPVKKSYTHALHTTLGNKEGPAGLTPMTTEQGFDSVFEQLIMSFLRDLSIEGAL